GHDETRPYAEAQVSLDEDRRLRARVRIDVPLPVGGVDALELLGVAGDLCGALEDDRVRAVAVVEDDLRLPCEVSRLPALALGREVDGLAAPPEPDRDGVGAAVRSRGRDPDLA